MYQQSLQSEGSGDSHTATSLSEGITLHFVPAPLGKRVLAYLIDLGIILAVIYGFLIVATIVGAISYAILISLFSPATSLVIAGVLLVMVLIVIAGFNDGYFMYYEYKRGYTFGKKCMGLRVITVDGGRLSKSQAIVRGLARYIDCFLVLPGLLSISATQQRQRLGDLMVGTVVVHSSRAEIAQEQLYLQADRYSFLRAILAPQEFDLKLSNDLLAEMFGTLQLSGKAVSAEKQRFWISKFLPYVNEIEAQKIQPTELLRFFAEESFKLVNNSRK